MHHFVLRHVQNLGARIMLPLLVSAAGLFLLGAGPEEAGQAPALPTGQEIMERFLEVSGGRQAFSKLNNRVVTSTMKMKGAGMEGTITTYQARPNKMYGEIRLATMGITRGTDGAVCWEKHPMMGLRIMEGKERALLLLLMRFDETDYQEDFKGIETAGVEEIQGQSCYQVVLSPNGALKPLTYYFAKDSGLLVKSDFTVEGSPAGPIRVETTLSDYKKVDGVLIPHQAVEKTLFMETLITVDKVEHNVTLPANRFALPAEVVEKLREERDPEPTTRPAPKVEDGSVDSDGVRIHYTVQGQGEALVLIHGFAGNMLEWKATGVVDLLSETHRVIVLDARGHGASDKPEGSDQYGAKMIEDVVRLLDHLGIRKAHLAGYSMGGLLVLKMAATKPERLRSGVIVDVGWIQADSTHAREFQDPPERIPGGALGACYRGMQDFIVTAEELDAIQVPILFLLAEDDIWAPSAKLIRSQRPDLEIIIVQGANHGTVLSKLQFKKAFQKFLEQQAQGA